MTIVSCKSSIVITTTLMETETGKTLPGSVASLLMTFLK